MWQILIALNVNAATPVKPAPPIWRPPPTANVNCLTPPELERLQTLQAHLEERKREAPGCDEMRGAAACLSPAEETTLGYLLARQAGEAEACGAE